MVRGIEESGVSEWKPVGEIALLQVQKSKLTAGDVYRTDALVAVERLRLTADGVFGLLDGDWILDRHHRAHPDARHWQPERVLSVGFTAHYEHMWGLFRRTELGSAGENLIVHSEEMITLADIAGGVRIESNGSMLDVPAAAVAEPCVDFTRYMTQRLDADATALKPEREKLRRGVRGFVTSLEGIDPIEIAPGAKLSVRAVP